MRVVRMAAGGILMMAVLGCGMHSRDNASGLYVSGRAQVVELYPELGQVVLENEDGTRINAFWQTEHTHAQMTGDVAGANSLSGPVGVYQPTVEERNTFPAKVGESIDYVGVRMGNEIMLGRVAVVR